MVELREGGFYRNRKGETIGPIQAEINDRYPFSCNDFTYTKNGFWMGEDSIEDDDLIEEVEIEQKPPALQLREGGFYRIRNGETVGPLQQKETSSMRRWFDNYGMSWTVNGNFWTDMKESRYDIIEEIEQKPQDTSEPINLTKLRDQLAMCALGAIGTWTPRAYDLTADEALNARAEWSYHQADAMLRARVKGVK